MLDPQTAAPPSRARPEPSKTGLLERSFGVLEAVAASPVPLGIGDLIERLELPRATVYRLVDWFLGEGFLMREPSRKRLVIGNRFSELAFNALRAAMTTAPRRLLLEKLARETGETCHIGTIDGDRVLYLDRVESGNWPLQLHLAVGMRVPLHATAIGKLFLALLPARQRHGLLATLELEALTPATHSDRARLEREIEDVRNKGFAIDDQEFLLGVVAIAVPIRNRRGEIRAGLAVQAPQARMTAADAIRHLPILNEMAERIGASFGAGFPDLRSAGAAPADGGGA